MNRKIVLAALIGLVVGAVGAILARPYLGERLPEAVTGKRETLQGPVTAKLRENDRLLLTVSTPSGAILATFTKKLGEIDLLVEQGDTVTLALPGYEPFLQDPPITRVAKPQPEGGSGSSVPPPTEAEADTTPPAAELEATARPDTIGADSASRWYD